MRDKFDYLDKTEGWIKVSPTTWRWKAIYENGQTLHQFNEENGRFHRFHEINQSLLKQFIMYSPHYTQEYTLDFPQGAKLTHKYVRGVINAPIDSERVYRHSYFFYVFGYDNFIMTLAQNGNLYFGDHVAKWAELEAVESAKQLR